MSAAPVREDRFAAAGDLGATLGVEEEYHLVDPTTWQLAARPDLVTAVTDCGSHLQPEMRTSQLEIASDVCHSLHDVRSALEGAREEAADAAAGAGVAILAAGTHPSAARDDRNMRSTDRYDRLLDRFGSVAREQNICGCHVHVAVPDEDTAVAVMTHARAYLPTLAAMTCSSPFQGGVDTGYQSFRSQWWSLWPVAGPPPALTNAEDYARTVHDLVRTGVIDDASTIYWDVRISSRYPTVEFRIADVCTELDDAVLHAALVRSLVRTVGRRIAAGQPPLQVSNVTLRAARWRAARFGLTDQLWCPHSGGLVPAATAVGQLLDELTPDLQAHGEADEVLSLVGALLARGTSAARQRHVFAASRNLSEVVRALTGQTVPSQQPLAGRSLRARSPRHGKASDSGLFAARRPHASVPRRAS
jgi:YbdK family carboxylate-amine ligase